MPAETPSNAPSSVVQGRLLLDPHESPELGWLRLSGGRIAEVHFGELPGSEAPPALGGRDRLVTPGFTDAHIHLPQIDQVGCDGMTLLEWLERVVFPAESWWGRGRARSDTRLAVRRMVREGTFSFAGYLTSHADASAEALTVLARTGMRVIAGRVAMDRHAPEALTAEDRGRARMRPIKGPILPASLETEHVRVSANPRFAIACTPELLAEIGWAVKERPGTFVQTHLAEMPEEVAKVRELFPDHESYTHVYDAHGLLTERTLLAHCIHLSDEEWRLIAARRSVAVHCPTANLFLQSGLFELDRAQAFGVRLALGSDVAGGPDVAMPRVARAMIEKAKIRAMTGRVSVRIPTPAEAWALITRVNAEELGWTDSGRIERGARADLLVLRAPESWFDEHLVGRLLYNWDHTLIEHRVLGGVAVSPDTI